MHTLYSQWVSQTVTRLRRGERPLLPGQHSETDVIPVNYALSPEQFRAWQESVINAVRAVKPIPTPDEWLAQHATTTAAVDPVKGLIEYRNAHTTN